MLTVVSIVSSVLSWSCLYSWELYWFELPFLFFLLFLLLILLLCRLMYLWMLFRLLFCWVFSFFFLCTWAHWFSGSSWFLFFSLVAEIMSSVVFCYFSFGAFWGLSGELLKWPSCLKFKQCSHLLSTTTIICLSRVYMVSEMFWKSSRFRHMRNT